MAATPRPDNPPRLSESEIEAISERLRNGEYLDDQYRDRLFRQPKEYELVYAAKESRGDLVASTMGVPLQTLRRFGEPRDGWSNKLVFGDNLQVLKTLFEMKERGELMNADGTPGCPALLHRIPVSLHCASSRDGKRGEGVRRQDRWFPVRRILEEASDPDQGDARG